MAAGRLIRFNLYNFAGYTRRRRRRGRTYYSTTLEIHDQPPSWRVGTR